MAKKKNDGASAPQSAESKAIDSITDLTFDDRNANKGTERGSGLIENSLRNYGAGRSVLADRNGVLIAGNKTVQGAIDAGIEKVRVIKTDGNELVVVQRTDLDLATDKAARELAIVDNRAGQISLEWDADVLADLAETMDVDLSAVGFSDKELEALKIDGEDGGNVETVEDEAPATAPKRVAAGDLWRLGDHFLKCGDSRNAADVEALLGRAVVNVAFTSPPYASQRKYDESSGFKPIPPDEYVDWWEAVQANVRAHLAPDGSFFVNIKEHCDDGERSLYVKDLTIAHVRRWGWKFVDEFSWNRPSPPGKWPSRFKNGFEPIFHFSRAVAIKFRPGNVTHESDAVPVKSSQVGANTSSPNGKYWNLSDQTQDGQALPDNVICVSGVESGTGHTAAFPVGLPAFFIKAYSDPGDVIYEPFCGSGTTLIAADQLGRRCFGMEISPGYCDVILARWEAHNGGKAEKVEAGA